MEDRILYSIDYPFEDVVIAAEWLDHAAISDADRSKLGRSNADLPSCTMVQLTPQNINRN
jgi:predicted TIM-barrel fold metal-dependent hydrolase